jgi:DNA-binding winged helix-turn-helix (wHTH) protein
LSRDYKDFTCGLTNRPATEDKRDGHMGGFRDWRTRADLSWNLHRGAVRKNLVFGPFRLVPSERRLEREGQPVPVGSRALDLLCRLAANPGDVVPKSELMAAAWPDLTVDGGSLRFHVAQLRRALGETEGDRYIQNVPGRGYCFVKPVSLAEAEQVQSGPPATMALQQMARRELLGEIRTALDPVVGECGEDLTFHLAEMCVRILEECGFPQGGRGPARARLQLSRG